MYRNQSRIGVLIPLFICLMAHFYIYNRDELPDEGYSETRHVHYICNLCFYEYIIVHLAFYS
jgi:hypothetical protein